MIEIIVLMRLCARIGDNAREKGRRAVGYQFMLLAMWFGFEVLAAIIVSVVLTGLYGDKADDMFFYLYISALIGAVLGAWLAFRIVANLSDLYQPTTPEPEQIE